MRSYPRAVGPCAVLALAVLGLGCPAPVTRTTHAHAPPTHVVLTKPPDAGPPPISTGLEPPQPTLRLPKNFTATGYEVRLGVDPAKPTFDGAISIVGEVAERSTVIWLHGRHLTIQRAAATRGDPYASPGGTTSAVTVTPRGDDLLELRADPALEPGTWTLAIEYTGSIDDVNTTGAFKETVAGAPYVFTQFEATYARRAFPCIDEPDSKVPWKLTIDAPAGVLAVSNTKAEKTTPLPDGGKRFEFARTKPLPSYLVAFGVGPFEIVDAGATKSGVPVRIVTLRGRAADAAFAVKTAPRIIELLEEQFGIPYPYDKMDMLTIPLTVGFGAMENAGLITFSEKNMLMDAQHPSWGKRHDWVLVAAHELAHQWFGDYVTTAYWDDIWLNEGFANWMETKIAAKFEPLWHDELGELDSRNAALQADGVVSARQIRQPIQSPDDILNVFDGITYDKGASVLNMFESYVGHDVFQAGVRDYLKSKAYGNATSADFVAAIAKSSGKELAPAFATFLEQPGAPEIEATVQCGAKPSLTVTQHRYVRPGSPTPPATKPWIVPMCVAYDRDGKRAETCALVEDHATIALDAKKCPRWTMPNVNGRGYYRTQYATSQVSALRDEAWAQLTWTERRSVFFDVVEATHGRSRATGQLPLTLALSLVPKMLAGADRFTIADAVELPTSLDRIVPDDQRAKYEAWLRLTFAPGAVKVGLLPKDTDDLDAEDARAALVSAAAWSGREPDLVKQATERATGWRDLPIAMRRQILTIAIDASPELFDRILHDVKTEADRTRREEMLDALADVRDPKRVTMALGLMLDADLDIRETMVTLFGDSTEATRRAAETFFRDHKDALIKRMPQDEVAGGLTSVTTLFTGACDAARRDEIVDYVQKTFAALPGGARVTQQAIEGMDQCIAARKVLEPQIRAWLAGVKIPKPKDNLKTK